MAKFTLNELKLEIAEILAEAKKKREKAEDIKKKSASVEAFGQYDEAFDFSAPLGAYNLYKQQGGVSWGPHTSAGTQVDSSFANPNLQEGEEKAIRAVVREVIENGLIPASSAWAPLVESQRETVAEGTWERADQLFEAWYDRLKGEQKVEDGKVPGKKNQGYEKTKYGEIKKHGQEKKGKK